MYDIDRQVWVKPVKRLARITTRRFVRAAELLGVPEDEPTRLFAVYTVRFTAGGGGPEHTSWMSHQLRAADSCCDGCSRWLPHSSFNGGATTAGDPYGDDKMGFCFLCVREGRRSLEGSGSWYW